jgi:hypothetical protein
MLCCHFPTQDATITAATAAPINVQCSCRSIHCDAATINQKVQCLPQVGIAVGMTVGGIMAEVGIVVGMAVGIMREFVYLILHGLKSCNIE